MMQSQPCRSVSWCQMVTVSCPSTGPSARRQSLSLHVPGKTTTPNFMCIPLESLSFDPFFAVFGDLFFPDGYSRFECINRVAAGVERLGAVRAGDHHHHAALADLQPPDTVDD